MFNIHECDIDFFYKLFKEIAIDSILLASMNVRIHIINLKIIKKKIVFSHVYNIRFKDSLLFTSFVINKEKREIINIIRIFFIIVNNTHYNNRILKFGNLYIFNKKLRHKVFIIIYIY